MNIIVRLYLKFIFILAEKRLKLLYAAPYISNIIYALFKNYLSEYYTDALKVISGCTHICVSEYQEFISYFTQCILEGKEENGDCF